MATTHPRGTVSLIVLVAFLVSALSACGGADTKVPNAEAAAKVVCGEIVTVSNAVVSADETIAPGKRKSELRSLGLDPSNQGNIKAVRDALQKREQDCQAAEAPSSSATPSATESPAPAEDDGEAEVENRDGSKEVVPVVKTAPDVPSANTTNDAMTPPTIPASVCPTLENWKTLVDCVEGHDMQWFIDGVNQRATKTGFDWSNIKRWANASNVDTVEVRAIEVFGGGISDAEARQRTAELVGQAANMAIVRQPHCFSNTRGLENSTMQDFVYCPPNSRQVRVSLLPVVMENGAIVGIRDTQSGVFVDCLNVWWIPPVVKVDGVPPQTPPAPKPVPKPKPKPSPTPQPGPSEKPSPTCPPGMHGKPPLCKDDPAKDPAAQGNAPTGGGKNADPGPGVPNPQPTFRPDPRPNPTPPPAPAPTPRPAPAPPPETQAPQPSAPVTQCIPAPGETSC